MSSILVSNAPFVYSTLQKVQNCPIGIFKHTALFTTVVRYNPSLSIFYFKNHKLIVIWINIVFKLDWSLFINRFKRFHWLIKTLSLIYSNKFINWLKLFHWLIPTISSHSYIKIFSINSLSYSEQFPLLLHSL